MISIEVNKKSATSKSSMRPTDLKGLPYGDVYVMRGVCEPNPTYFLCTGHCSDPIMFWFDNEDGDYKIACSDLDGYAEHIYVEKVDAKITMKMKV
jgi:hypothetical protein